MSAQIVGKKLTRRIAESTGQDVIRAWGHGGYSFPFVTADHRHGIWNKVTGHWEWQSDPLHYATCKELFPDVPRD